VYLAAIAGYLPSAIVQCIATFMDACYIARRNAITGPALQHFRSCVEKFHALRNMFIQAGVRTSISLPRQHALDHYFYAICLFGSPNGLCSSITESKHIKAVKEPWRRSSRYRALIQMLRILVRMDKMAALQHKFAKMGMLVGTTASYMAQMKAEDEDVIAEEDEFRDSGDDDEPMAGNPSDDAMSDVKLTSRYGMSYTSFLSTLELMYLYDRTSLSLQSQSPCKIYKPAFVSLCSPSIPLPP
jgi:hypothetical protein